MKSGLDRDASIKHSFWYSPSQPRQPLTYNTSADVAIIGGGIAGLSAAYHLGKRGYGVVLVEANEVGSGGTGNSTGIVSHSGVEPELRDFLKSHTKQEAKDLWSYLERAAIDLKYNIQNQGMNCDLREGCLSLVADIEEAKKEIKAYEELGLPAPILVQGDDLRSLFDSDTYSTAMHYNRDFCVNPVDLCREFARAAERNGSKIYEKSCVARIDPKRKTIVMSDGSKINAGNIVISTNPYTFDLEGLPRTARRRVASVHNYISQLEITKSPNGRSPVQNVYGFWDDGECGGASGYIFARAIDDKTILIASSKSLDFTTASKPKDAEEFTEENITVARKMFPVYEFRHVNIWGGRIGITPEQMQKMGQIDDGIYTTSIGDGIPIAHLSGALIAELIDERRPIPRQFDINSSLSRADWVKVTGFYLLPAKLLDPATRFYEHHFVK